MKSNKKYTTQTFTKRVDHEGGLHRPGQKLAEPAFCEKCGSSYSHGHWITKGLAADSHRQKQWRPFTPVLCPACKQIETGAVGGYVSLSGDFFTLHHEDIENLIENEAKRAAIDNPLARIMNQSQTDCEMKIETTTEHLAQRLGHAVKKAFDGDVEYHFSDENKVTRVTWHRDQ